MSKKLLSEAQIRRFQSLASINPINEMGDYAMKRDEEVEEGMYKRDEEPQEGMYKEEEYMEAADDEEKMEEEMEMDDEAKEDDDEQVEVEEEMVEKAAAALSDLQALVDALGGEAAGEMGDMGGEDEMPMPVADEPEEDEPAVMEEEDNILELALEGIQYEPSQKEIVQEVAKRVARRLMEAKKAQASLNKALGNK